MIELSGDKTINKDNKHSIPKAELEIIMNMYRQQRYDECIKEVKSKLKQSSLIRYIYLIIKLWPIRL